MGTEEARSEEPTITAELYSSSASESETAKWRSQLEKKFEPAREKFPDLDEAQRLVDDIFRPEIPGLREADASDVDSRRGEQQLVDESPIEDRASVPEPVLPRRPAQQALSLEPLLADLTTRAKARSEEDVRQAVSKEVLFSRILSGILDLLLPIGIAVLFVFTACWFIGLDFFSYSATYSWLLLALGFFFFNSLYFFWTAGRTPGMSATDLRLAGQDSEDPPFASVVLRILLFLPVTATLIGLVLALFDPECRALHDRLSGTKVVSE